MNLSMIIASLSIVVVMIICGTCFEISIFCDNSDPVEMQLIDKLGILVVINLSSIFANFDFLHVRRRN